MIYDFDQCRLDTGTQQLWRDGQPVHVEPQVLAVLAHLAANHDRVVTKIELMDEVWGDRFVSESALTSRIKLARKACGDNGRDQRILKTVHSRGYRFVAELRADQPPPSPTGGHRISSRVVGRAGELGRLDAMLAEARAGGRRAAFVCGGIGAGKSTLLAEFLERQDTLDGTLVARGRCIQTRGGVEPYFCLFDAIGRLAVTEPELVRDTLDRSAPSWLAQLPSLLDDERSAQLERRLLGSTAGRMLREGADAIEALARHRPLVLLLEDLHWADDLTLDVIDLLVQRTDPVPLLLVGTARPDHLPLRTVIAAAVAAGKAVELELDPLEHGAVADLMVDRFDGAEVPDALVRIVADRSGGVPLFADEIVSSWIRQRQVLVEGGAAGATLTVAGALDELRATVPHTLPPLVERELLEMTPDELTVLEACAVAGETFGGASVAAGLGRPVSAVETVTTALARERGLVVATGASSWPDGTLSASYAFTHGLYRQVVYDRIPPTQRRLLHGRIGLALERGHGEAAPELAAELAAHFIEAGDDLRAIGHLRRAGEQAAARSGHDHAARFLTDALERTVRLPPGPDRDRSELAVRMSLGPALVATRGWFDPSVSANYERALELCADDEGCPEAAAARYGLATVSELQGRFERTEALLTPLLQPHRDGELAMEASELVACSLFHQGAFDRSLDTATNALATWDEDAYSVLMARIAEHPASSCNSWASLASWALGRSDESLRQAERAVELGERNLYALSTAVQQRAMLHQIRNEPEACIEWSDRCREVGREQDFPMRMVQADIYKGWALAVLGRVDEGTRLVADGLARFREAGATLNEAYYLGLYADTRLRAGEGAEAMELLDQALGSMQATTRTYFFQSELHRLRARGFAQLGGPGAIDAARGALDESLDVADRQGSPALALRTLVDRVELERSAGDDGDEARWRERLAAAMGIHDGQRPTPDVERARELLGG